MCAEYIGAGLPPERFWDITPRLYITEMQGARKLLERQQSERIETAWITAALTRAKKMPPLDRMLRRKAKAKPQSPEQQQVMCEVLAAAWGAKPAR